MDNIQEAQRASLQSLLEEMKAVFDKQMTGGATFEEIKKTYLQIKEVEFCLTKGTADPGQR